MPDYKKMYNKLFQSQSMAIEILQQAQLEVEEMYIEADETPLQLFSKEQKEPQNKKTTEKKAAAKAPSTQK